MPPKSAEGLILSKQDRMKRFRTAPTLMNDADTQKAEALAEEGRRMRRLRLLVDLATVVVRERPLSRDEALQVVEHLRDHVVSLFPDKGEVFDLIYRPRFGRLIDERFGKPT